MTLSGEDVSGVFRVKARASGCWKSEYTAKALRVLYILMHMSCE